MRTERRGAVTDRLPGPFRQRLLPAAAAVGTAAVMAMTSTVLGPPLPARAAPSPSRRTEAQVAAMDPVAQARLLAPLRAAAQALDRVGRGAWRSAYAGVAIEAADRRTDLYLTDVQQAPALLNAARRLDPGVGPGAVRVHPAAYALATLDAASLRFLRQPHPFPVYAVSPAPDASGLQVDVSDPVVAGRRAPLRIAARAGGGAVEVPLAFVRGSARQPRNWAHAKWQDATPFIGGDVLTPDGHHYCTAGLPAVRVRDRHPVLVTAAHCFRIGQRIYTAGGRTWDWGNGRTGNYVGRVVSRNTHWDAEVLVGANNNADESDTSGYKPLTSVAYSYRGDYVCHSGARSASRGHPTPCGIKVTRPDLYFEEGGHLVRGVEGVDVRTGWGSISGDSGGTVFAVTGRRSRQLRGIVSSGGADGTPDQRRVDWPEAVDIFRAYGLRLNPKT